MKPWNRHRLRQAAVTLLALLMLAATVAVIWLIREALGLPYRSEDPEKWLDR